MLLTGEPGLVVLGRGIIVFFLHSKANDRRTIKPADFIIQFYRPIFSVKLEPSYTAEFITDKIN